MSYLIDENVWLELLLRQQHADEVRQFLQMIQLDEISLTESTLYLIGIITSRLKKEDVFAAFLSDLLEETGIKRIALSLADLRDLLSAMREQDLDFDDAYQYVAALNNDLILVSFDKDVRSCRGTGNASARIYSGIVPLHGG